ncbi:MAG: septal ring lytic transglycosylase RlpA family protein [Nevskiaceae bacterium]|nr:MAG: septal ring lytic transglycosylase RlpA family protein [Nevskiaceae bacterium]TBR72522.1 MAG: septal ring lytic transglycosylase RlpA family protein [Nevskiaceae bacterium]
MDDVRARLGAITARHTLELVVLATLVVFAGCSTQRTRAPGTYEVDGKTYQVMTPAQAQGYDQTGDASWYGPGFHGKTTSSGAIYDMYGMTAASKTLPLGSRVSVTNLENGKSVVLEVNDRGPFVPGRIIDVSYSAARTLGMVGPGTAPVRVKVLGGQPQTRAPTMPPVAPSGSYQFLQAGVFTHPEGAAKLRDQLHRLGITQVQLLATNFNGTDASRVLIGPIADAAQAEQLRDTLARAGIGSIPYPR